MQQVAASVRLKYLLDPVFPLSFFIFSAQLIYKPEYKRLLSQIGQLGR